MDANSIIHTLGLEPLPDEGGYFRRVWTHPLCVPGTERPLASRIYYLITPEAFSAIHRIDAEESLHFHAGDPVEMLQLHPDGRSKHLRLGLDLEAGERPYAAIPAGSWQGCRLAEGAGAGYALFTATVSPGFVWDGFELGTNETLTRDWPKLSPLITTLCHH